MREVYGEETMDRETLERLIAQLDTKVVSLEKDDRLSAPILLKDSCGLVQELYLDEVLTGTAEQDLRMFEDLVSEGKELHSVELRSSIASRGDYAVIARIAGEQPVYELKCLLFGVFSLKFAGTGSSLVEAASKAGDVHHGSRITLYQQDLDEVFTLVSDIFALMKEKLGISCQQNNQTD